MTNDRVLAVLTARYDKQFPNAEEFARGEVEYRYRTTLEDIEEAGYRIGRVIV